MTNDSALKSASVSVTSPEVPPRVFSQLLTVFSPEQVKRDEPLSAHTYVQVGGKADIAVFPSNYRQVREAVLLAKHFGLAHWVIGNGSNQLVRDGGVRGLAIILTRLSGIRRADHVIIAQGGASVIRLSQFARQNQLSRLEFACGIPATVGGGVRMNAGAYGGQMSDVLESVRVLTEDGEETILGKADLGLTYRDSAIGTSGWIVLEAAFGLVSDAGEAIQARMDDFTLKRRSKQPLEYPSCGSVFKRPPHDYAGRLIQAAGLQGLRIGGAEVSTKHAGFIVNVDHASASDYLALIHRVQAVVKRKYDVALELEVTVIGDDLRM